MRVQLSDLLLMYWRVRPTYSLRLRGSLTPSPNHVGG